MNIKSSVLDGMKIFQVVSFNGTLVYAKTVHKGQGSGFDNVIVALDDASNGTLNNVEMLYTGITRAKIHCSLIATAKAVYSSIRNKQTITKQTFLPYLFEGRLIDEKN